jgi:cytoskeleton protein RodZ
VSEFGNKFKTARELRDRTFKEIAQETRISTRFLRAIESENFDELPGGIFNRGFVRTYAQAVGLDADAMVEEYRALREDAAPPEKLLPTPSLPPTTGRDRHVLPAAIGGLAVLVFLFYVGSRGGESFPGDTRPVEFAAARVPPPGTPPAQAPAPPPGLAAGSEGVVAPEAERATPETSSEEHEDEVPEPLLTAPDVSRQPPTTAADTPTTAPSVTVRVEVMEKPTEMYVEVDGEVKYSYIMINPPFWRNYPVNEALELRIGNPSAVSLSIDGRPVPSLGPPDEIWTGTITPENAALLTGS